MKYILLILLVMILLLSGCVQEQLETGGDNSVAAGSESNSDAPDYNPPSLSEPHSEQGAPVFDAEAFLDPTPDIDDGYTSEMHTVGDWVYFLYSVEPSEPDMLALFRWREDGSELTRLSTRSYELKVLNGDVYYDSYPIVLRDHGELYLIPGGEGEPLLLAEELGGHQLLEPYIYYFHSYDTIGVGIQGHALYRIDLDGSNPTIVAYETAGPGIGGGHSLFHVEGEYAYVDTIRIRMGEPANGMEAVEVIEPTAGVDEDGWIYYATNRLIKARPDGSEQIILHGDEDTWIYVQSIDDEWIYFVNYSSTDLGTYKISKEGGEMIVAK